MSITISAAAASAAVSKAETLSGQGKGQDNSGDATALFAELVDSRLALMQGGLDSGKAELAAERKPADEALTEKDKTDLAADALAALLNQAAAPLAAATTVNTVMPQLPGHAASKQDNDETAAVSRTGEDEGELAGMLAAGSAEAKGGKKADASAATPEGVRAPATATPAPAVRDEAGADKIGDRKEPTGAAALAVVPADAGKTEDKAASSLGVEKAVTGAATATVASPTSVLAGGIGHGMAGAAVSTATAAATEAAVNLPVATPVTHPDWTKDVGRNVLLMANHKLDSAQMQLNPANLGPIEVTLKMEGDKIANVSFVAAAQPTRDALEQGMHKLASMLSQNGMQLNDANVFSGEQQQREAERQAQLAGQQRDSSQGPRFSLDMADGRSDSASGTESALSRTVAVTDGGVSIYA